MEPLGVISELENYKIYALIEGRVFKTVYFRLLDRQDQPTGEQLGWAEGQFRRACWKVGNRQALRIIIDGISPGASQVHFTLANYGGVPIPNTSDCWPLKSCQTIFRLLTES